MAEQQEVSQKLKVLLKALVEEYIAKGQPVSSKILARKARVKASPATVRNAMAQLEELGYVCSPHTSAGRVPTVMGYRLFVDSLITMGRLDARYLINLNRQLDPDKSSIELVETASGILSEMTRLAGLVTIPRPGRGRLRQIDCLRLDDNRVLVILVLDDHEVQNRVIHPQRAYTEAQLREVVNYINRHYAGKSLQQIRKQLISSMRQDKQSMNSMMQGTLEVAEQALSEEQADPDFVMKGQENLLVASQALEDIRSLAQAFSMKGDILHLLERCMETDGVQLFIGNESGFEMLDDLSLVTMPYRIDGQTVGVLGVIGPTRMAYQRIIPAVDATARALSAAFEHHLVH